MLTREQFLVHLWKEVINAPLRGHWIDNVLASSERDPKAPFAEVGPRETPPRIWCEPGGLIDSPPLRCLRGSV